MRECFNGFLPCTSYWFHFESNRQRIWYRDDPSWPTNSVWHIRYTVLLQEMECIGLKESVVKWFQSYLSKRKFLVTLENVFSDVGLIHCGAPQRSILGPLLFLIYVNNLPQGHTLMLTIPVYFIMIRMLKKQVLNKEFSSLCEWCIDIK